ncbi:hypothetical protein FOA52_004776 [Chlamydomonas sp. UWO 241]|nr:hypothetical protein FOA52_004776 [Chlamydomonas sp. UWO 241]
MGRGPERALCHRGADPCGAERARPPPNAPAVARARGCLSSSVLSELDRRFPIDAVLNALAVVYPHFWWRHEAAIRAARESGGELAALKAEATMRTEFESRLDVIDKHFGQPKQLAGAEVPQLIDATQLRRERQRYMQWVRWRSMHLKELLEDERAAAEAAKAANAEPAHKRAHEAEARSTSPKSKSCNRLQNPHLSDALRLFFSNTFDVLTFPYAEALQAWKEAVDRGRYNKTFT